MAFWTRRRFLTAAGAAIGGGLGLRFIGPRLLRPSAPRPVDQGELGQFVERCFSGLERTRVWDTHVHAAGIGAGGSGCWINPEMEDHAHPIKRLRYDIYRQAVGMANDETADQDYIARLLELQRLANPQGKLVLLAFDLNVDERGNERHDLSPFHVPDDYVLRLAREHPELVACVSIHPYRRDAAARLDAAAAAGARAVKWLPNSMGIDPASPLCDPFYRRLAVLGLPLITHAGSEWTVPAHDQALGNPLRLRRPLDAGVTMVVAHCASFGEAQDLDRTAGEREEMSAFELFVRLLDEPQYRQTLYGDISALVQINRSGRPLREMLKAREYHPRLVNGSDYPVPELGAQFGTAKLRLAGLLSPDDHRLCSAMRTANPLLHDLLVKRSLRLEEDGVEYRFSAEIFESARLFGADVTA